MRRSRLVTLVGAAGSGKTRLSLEVARRLEETRRDGSLLIELASLNEGSLIPHAVASALGISGFGTRPVEDVVIERLKRFDGLLVVDNCEHLIDAVAALIHRALRACPYITVLATSREALRADGECVWPVPTLSEPEAVLLFVDRAQRASPGFELTPENEGHVRSICRHLDGLPLAIELAAAHMPSLTPAMVAAHLNDRFRLLTTGLRTAPARHKTLRAAIDWSYDLLSTSERHLFASLGVFAGSFDGQAVASISSGSPAAAHELSELLRSLVSKSLVGGHDGRYRLLETLRAYALDRLNEMGEAPKFRIRHAQYFAELGTLEADRFGPLPVQDADNFREALGWTRSADRTMYLQLACSFGWYCQHSGLIAEGRSWLEEALQGPVDKASLARVHFVLSVLAWRQSDNQAAEYHAFQVVKLQRAINDRRALARALGNLAFTRIGGLDFEGARAALAEEMSVIDELGDPRLRGEALFHTGLLNAHQHRLVDAERDLKQSAALHAAIGREDDNPPVYSALGWVRLMMGDSVGANESISNALRARIRLNLQSDAASSLDAAAEVAFLEGLNERAMRLKGAADAILERSGARAQSMAAESRARWVRKAERSLGGLALKAWREGYRLTLEEAVEYALRPTRTLPRVANLTTRERQVAALVKTGITNDEIAARLAISKRTVDAHLDHIRAKIGARSRVEIANWVTADSEAAASPR